MLGFIFISLLFVAASVVGLLRPFWGVVGFYSFVFLQPEWNWRWSIPPDFGFQKYIAAAVLIGILLNGFRGNAFRGWLGVTVYSLLGFLVLAYVSASQSVEPHLTSRFMDTITKTLVMTFVTIRVVDTPEKCRILLWAIVLCSGYNAFRINEEYFALGYCRYVQRPWGLKGDSNVYSVFTMPAIAASVSLALLTRDWWQRGLAGIILMLQLHQIMLMESRGTMLGLMVVVATTIWLMPKTGYTIKMTVIAGVLASMLAGPPVVNEFVSAFEAEEDRDSSAESRFTLWKAGYEITRDNPWLGVGPYAVQAVIPLYAAEFSEVRYKAPHNLYFELSAGCGVPATFLYLLFCVVPWYVAYRFYRANRDTLPFETLVGPFTLAVCLPGYFLASMFSSGALVESLYVMVAACGGAAYSAGATFFSAPRRSLVTLKSEIDSRTPVRF